MEGEQTQQDLGRSDFVPNRPKAKVTQTLSILGVGLTRAILQYSRRYEVGDTVWMESGKYNPPIVVYVKDAQYDKEKDGWVYMVQEKDDKGWWAGRERWKRETALHPA